MNKILQTGKVKFWGLSLLWASLLYACVIGAFNLIEKDTKKIEPVSYSQTSSKQTIPVSISVDSLQKKISITHSLFSYFAKQLKN